MSSPLVTISMAAYNAEVYIAEAIDSILNQTYTNFELLIFNDGSTDNTSSIIKSYTDKRIHSIDHAYNMGIRYSRNQALTKANGQYLFWMDADDISSAERIEKQVILFENEPATVVCGTGTFHITNQGNTLFASHPRKNNDDIKSALFFGFPFVNPSIGIRTNIVREKNILINDEVRQAEDYVLLAKLLPHGDFRNIDEPLYSYRVHESENRITSFKNSIDIINGRKITWRIILGYLNITVKDGPLELHDKITYYRQLITRKDIDHAERYFTMLGQLLTQNKKQQMFNQQMLQNFINSFSYMVIMHQLMPLSLAVRLIFTHNHLLQGINRLTILPKKAAKLLLRK